MQFDAARDPTSALNALNLIPWAINSWTPDLTFVTPGDLSVGYGGGGTARGHYVKIGKVIHAAFNIATTTFTWTTASGTLRINGLPFPSNSSMAFVGSLDMQGITTAYGQIATEIPANTSRIQLIANTSPITRQFIAASDTTSGTNLVLRGQITYWTS